MLTLESRRATETAALIATYGGRAIVAPALREVPLESNDEAQAFASLLLRGAFDITIFLTGVGTRALVVAIEPVVPLTSFTDALARTKVVARGPKPLAALRELGVPVWASAPEPNTWREVVEVVEKKMEGRPLTGLRVAVQEYGVPNVDLLSALRERGAEVTSVAVYRWALPEDTEPLRKAAAALAAGDVDALLVTSGIQFVHLWRIVAEMGIETDVRNGLARVLVASIGPTTSEELRRHHLTPALEASHPKLGILVREAAESFGSSKSAV